MSPDLATLQNNFSRAVLANDATILSAVDLEADAARRRLAIYRNTALSGLVGALRLSYPMIEKVVGTPFFDQTALAFAREHPPADPVLARYGAGFSEFLESDPRLAALPYLPDLARLDWAIDQAGYAPTMQTRRIVLEAATVTFAPSLRLLATSTAVLPLWQALHAGDEDALGGIDWNTGPQWLAIHDSDEGVRIMALSEPAWRLAAALLAEDDVDPAAEAAVELLSAPFVRITPADPEASKRNT